MKRLQPSRNSGEAAPEIAKYDTRTFERDFIGVKDAKMAPECIIPTDDRLRLPFGCVLDVGGRETERSPAAESLDYVTAAPRLTT